MLVLVIEYHVYRSRCTKRLSKVEAFKRECYMIRNMEKHGAVANNKLAIHNRKWYGVSIYNEKANEDVCVNQYIESM